MSHPARLGLRPTSLWLRLAGAACSGPASGGASERGMALIAVLLMMMLMSSMAAGFAISSRTEIAISRNEDSYAQSRAAAEAGLNQAVVLLGTPTAAALNAVLAGPDGEVSASNPAASVNADNGSLASLFSSQGPWQLTAGDARYTFDVLLVDDDDPALFDGSPTPAQLKSIGENGSGAADANGRYVIRASGFGPGETRVTVEAMLLPAPSMPAIVTNGALTLSGSAKIKGTSGSVHTNQHLTVSTKNVVVSKDATASGTYTVAKGWQPGGVGSSNATQVTPPSVSAAEYKGESDLILTSGGLIKNRATNAIVCNASSTKTACKASYGWTYVSTSGGWNMNHTSGVSATYYVEGPATLSGSPGSTTAPILMTVVAEGSITVSGSPKIAPEASSGLLFVTNQDLKITGSINQPLSGEGRILVREQVQISGSVSLKAQLLVENAARISSLVTSNSISGSGTITYNGTLGSQTYTVGGWREES